MDQQADMAPPGGRGCALGVLLGLLVLLPVTLAKVAFAPVPWLLAERRAWKRPVPAGGFALTEAEYGAFRAARARRKALEQRREELVQQGLAQGLRVRKDGLFDERNRGAPAVNDQIGELVPLLQDVERAEHLALWPPRARHEEWSEGRVELWGLRFALVAWLAPLLLRAPMAVGLLESAKNFGPASGRWWGISSLCAALFPYVGMVVVAWLVGCLGGVLLVNSSAPFDEKELLKQASSAWGDSD